MLHYQVSFIPALLKAFKFIGSNNQYHQQRDTGPMKDLAYNAIVDPGISELDRHKVRKHSNARGKTYQVSLNSFICNKFLDPL